MCAVQNIWTERGRKKGSRLRNRQHPGPAEEEKFHDANNPALIQPSRTTRGKLKKWQMTIPQTKGAGRGAFFPTPLPRQCKGGLPVHKSCMPLSAWEGPGSVKIRLSPNLPPGNSPLDSGTPGVSVKRCHLASSCGPGTEGSHKLGNLTVVFLSNSTRVHLYTI